MLACVVTFLTPLAKTLRDLGHVSANAVQECAWSILVVIQSFIGCIAKLMKSSGLEVYVAAAYAGLTGIIRVTSP